MLRVVHANRLDELAAALTEALPPPGDPFTRTTVVTPGPLFARWVTFEVARRRGIAAQLDLPFLDPFVVRTWTDDAAGRAARLGAMDRRRLAALVASALADDDVLADDAMAPVREYLAGGDAPGPARVGRARDDDREAARRVRRVQLAARVAGLAWEYALTRPEWLDAWEAGRVGAAPDGVDATTWAWQGRLIAAVARATARIATPTRDDHGGAAPGPAAAAAPGAAAAAPIRWITTPRLPRARRALGLPPPRLAGAVHVIGFSFLAPAYLDALAELADGGDVIVHALDPCAELWEDVPGRAARRPRRADVPAGAVADDDPRALRLWGRPARDTLARLIELSDGDLTERFVDPGDATALARLRGDLVRRAATTSAVPPPAGVAVLACPSLTRELEIVASDVRRRLDADPALAANQIAVLAAGADAERYFAQLPAIFDGLGVPWHQVDAPLAEHGRVAEAALMLLELPLGRFARPELLGVMTHPAVLARHRRVDPEDWLAWAERLGIVHGADADDHAGTYLDGLGELFHWDQGIRRLALGAFMAGGDAPVALAGRAYLPEPLAPDQQASAATFALLARSLIADATWLRGEVRPLAGWAAVLTALVATYVGARDPLAVRELERVRRELAALADLDLDGRAVGYHEVVEIARRAIGGLRGDRGQILARGVLVARLEPGRALPARHTYVIGAGEGQLPDPTPRSPLDLRAETRRGDVSAGDRDRYAFLEALLAPDASLTISYVARDLETGDALAPSSVVLELAEMLAPHTGASGGADALARLTVHHPLHRWDPRYDDDDAPPSSLAPGRARERRANLVRAELTAALADRGVAVPPPHALAQLLARARLPRLARALRLDPAADLRARRAAAHDDAPIALSVSALRRFLEAPLQAWASAVLRLDDDDDEARADRADEPFATGAAERAALLRAVFARHLGEGDAAPVALDAAYDALAGARQLAGQAPVGVFGRAERARDLELLGAWSAEVRARGARGWRRHAFGRSAGAAPVRHPALALDVTIAGRARRVELVGATELCADGVGSLVLQPGKLAARHALRAAMDSALLAAAGVAPGHGALILHDDGAAELGARPWPADAARAHLAALAGELLGDSHAYLLDLDVVKAVRDGKPPTLKRRDKRLPGTLGYGPITRAEELELPADVAALVARRYAAMIDRLVGKHALGGGKA